MGIVPGAADMNLDLARCGYHGLRIEMKSADGKQSEKQRNFQNALEKNHKKTIVTHEKNHEIRRKR